ncbi:hypothetical protein JW935_05420 [candidate division KSB1 bacterium]|nr:hypothetical protein [candidate division KSB1 bacterium]
MFFRRSILVLLLFVSIVLAQNVDFQARLLNKDIKVFMLSDLNFTGSGTALIEIFELTFFNPSDTRLECRLTLDITAMGLGELANGSTNPFILAGGETKRITNLNLFTSAGIFSLQDYNLESAGRDLLDKILATGKLPSDRYFFNFSLYYGAASPEIRSFYIDVTNPSNLDLLGPGGPAEEATRIQIFTTNPMFRWESNMDRFRLIVAEKLEGVHDDASPEQIIQDQVRFEQEFLITEKGDIPTETGVTLLPTTSFLYPAAGVWPLEYGKTYYWQIIGILESSGAPIELPSEIWAFQIHDPMDGRFSPAQLHLLRQLELALGENFQEMLKPGGPLAGFSPTGVFSINGRSITMEELLQILTKIQSGEFELVSLSVE